LTENRVPEIRFRKVRKHYDDAREVIHALSTTEGREALLALEQYANGVILQWNRIISREKARAALSA